MNIKQRYLTKGQSEVWYLGPTFIQTFGIFTVAQTPSWQEPFLAIHWMESCSIGSPLVEPSVASKPVRHDALWEVRKY
jgi:hypothetical protein